MYHKPVHGTVKSNTLVIKQKQRQCNLHIVQADTNPRIHFPLKWYVAEIIVSYLEELIPYTALPKTQRMFTMRNLWSREQSPITFGIISITACGIVHPPCDFWLASDRNVQNQIDKPNRNTLKITNPAMIAFWQTCTLSMYVTEKTKWNQVRFFIIISLPLAHSLMYESKCMMWKAMQLDSTAFSSTTHN